MYLIIYSCVLDAQKGHSSCIWGKMGLYMVSLLALIYYVVIFALKKDAPKLRKNTLLDDLPCRCASK